MIEINISGENRLIANRVNEVINMEREQKMKTEEFDRKNICEFLDRMSQCL